MLSHNIPMSDLYIISFPRYYECMVIFSLAVYRYVFIYKVEYTNLMYNGKRAGPRCLSLERVWKFCIISCHAIDWWWLRDIFSYFSLTQYVVTPHLNRLFETVWMGKRRFRWGVICLWAELAKIIQNYHQMLRLIWSSDFLIAWFRTYSVLYSVLCSCSLTGIEGWYLWTQ